MKKISKIIGQVLKSFFLQLVFWSYHFFLTLKKVVSLKNFPFITVPIFLVLTIFLNSTEPFFLISPKPKGEIIIKEGFLKEKETSSHEDKKSDFQIAAILEDEEDPSYPITTFGGAAFIEPESTPFDGPPTRTEIETYIVQEGDTISSIAEKFHLSVETILWENKLSARSIIRPGQELKILPVTGLTYKVKQGDTLEKIAKKYKAKVEEIMEFNGISDPSDIYAGDVLIIPNGVLPPPPPPQPRRYAQSADKIQVLSGQISREASGANCHKFIPGQCTWYVAQKRCIPWTGHAKHWIQNARAMGYAIGDQPALGAVIAIRESWYGHVGYVEDFDEKTVTFTEMNHLGPWIVTRRTLQRNDWRIIGYIY